MTPRAARDRLEKSRKDRRRKRGPNRQTFTAPEIQATAVLVRDELATEDTIGELVGITADQVREQRRKDVKLNRAWQMARAEGKRRLLMKIMKGENQARATELKLILETHFGPQAEADGALVDPVPREREAHRYAKHITPLLKKWTPHTDPEEQEARHEELDPDFIGAVKRDIAKEKAGR